MEITPNVLMNTMLQNAQSQEQRIARLENEVATGQVFQWPADSPARVTTTMSLNQSLAVTNTYQSSVSAANCWLNAAAGALQNAQSVLQQVIATTTQALNGGLNSGDYKALQQSVLGAMSSLRQAFNTQYQGAYIFSGYQTQTQPVPNPVPAGWTWPGTAADARTFQVGVSSTVTVNVTGYEAVGQPAGTNYLQSTYQDLATLVQDLASANPPAAMAGPPAILSNLKADAGYLSAAQSIVGARLQRMQQTQQHLQTLAYDLEQGVAYTSGANMTTVATQLAQEQQAYQATLQSGARVLPLSLLNFITP